MMKLVSRGVLVAAIASLALAGSTTMSFAAKKKAAAKSASLRAGHLVRIELQERRMPGELVRRGRQAVCRRLVLGTFLRAEVLIAAV